MGTNIVSTFMFLKIVKEVWDTLVASYLPHIYKIYGYIFNLKVKSFMIVIVQWKPNAWNDYHPLIGKISELLQQCEGFLLLNFS